MRTWAPDSGQTMTSDPPPPSIWVYQKAFASVSGNGPLAASDGLGYPAFDIAGASPPRKESFTDAPGKLKKLTVSNGVATLTCTLSASGSDVEPTGGGTSPTGPGTGQVEVGLGVTYTTTIHAQPYNLRPGPGELPSKPSPYMNPPDPTNNYVPDPGGMAIQYVFSSTSGSVADINWSVVKLGEIVNYNASEGTAGSSNGTPTFIPPSPPFSPLLVSENPTIIDLGPLPNGFFWDLHFAKGSVKDYKYATYTATQKYVMNDTVTGEMNVVLRGPLSIVRTIGPRVLYTAPWWFHISKDGFENWYQLLIETP